MGNVNEPHVDLQNQSPAGPLSPERDCGQHTLPVSYIAMSFPSRLKLPPKDPMNGSALISTQAVRVVFYLFPLCHTKSSVKAEVGTPLTELVGCSESLFTNPF